MYKAEAETETDEDENGLPGFVALSSGCVDKQHLKGTTKKETSVQGCEKACAGNPGCVGFDFYAAKSMCYLKSNCEGTPGKCTQSKAHGCGYQSSTALGPYWTKQMTSYGHVSAADQSKLRCAQNTWWYHGKNTKVGCGKWHEACSAPFLSGIFTWS